MKKVLLSSVTALSLFWLTTPTILIVRADESGDTYVAENYSNAEDNSKEMTPDELRGIVDAIKEQNGGKTALDEQVTETQKTTPSGQPAVIDTQNGDKALIYGEKTEDSQSTSSTSTPSTPASSEPASSAPSTPASSASSASSSNAGASKSSASTSDTRSSSKSKAKRQSQGQTQRPRSSARSQAGRTAAASPTRAASRAISRALKVVAADLKKTDSQGDAADPAAEADEQSLPKTSAVK